MPIILFFLVPSIKLKKNRFFLSQAFGCRAVSRDKCTQLLKKGCLVGVAPGTDWIYWIDFINFIDFGHYVYLNCGQNP
jgi:hypothetical protein